MKLVLIEWIDCHGQHLPQWIDLEELKGNCEYLYIRSVGWLVKRTKKVTLIVPHISGERNGNLKLFGRGDFVIPNKAIIKMTILRKS